MYWLYNTKTNYVILTVSFKNSISFKSPNSIKNMIEKKKKNSIETSQRIPHTGTNSTRGDLAS